MDKKNFSECGIIQDLLPLYYDDVCTPASKELVQRHLEHCVTCRALYEELKDHSVDRVIETESRQVLERHARKERTAAWKAGLIISVLLLIPVILTFLFSIAVGGGLGVFSVTTASMLLVAALTAVPLMTEQKKLTKSILAGIFALLLILFFVDRMNGGGQFLLLAIPTIFGLSVPLFPFVIRGLALPPVLSDKKALLTMVWDTAWLFLTIFTVCHHSGDVEGLRSGTLISVILMSGVWLVFLTARYLPANRWIKAGLISLITGIWMAFSSDAYGLIAEHKRQFTILAADFSDWTSTRSINANTYLLFLAAGILLGILCIAIGSSWRRVFCLGSCALPSGSQEGGNKMIMPRKCSHFRGNPNMLISLPEQSISVLSHSWAEPSFFSCQFFNTASTWAINCSLSGI